MKVSLVLEGGGMRGMYTSGVLDAFMDNNIFINNIYAVSAGCYNALFYLSRQRGKCYKVNSTYLKDKRYIDVKRILVGKSAVNTDFIFNEIFKELEPFDYTAFNKYVGEFYAVSTNALTGEPYYARIKNLEEDKEYVKASAALPLFTHLVKYNELVLSDGGDADSIPVMKAIEDGFDHNIVILTRPKGFILGDNKLMKFNKIRYKKYPNLIKTMENRKIKYNETLKLLEKLESENKVIVIRPKKELDIGNLEKNEERIRTIYEMGYDDGVKYISEIKRFLKGDENVKKEKRRI